MSYQTRTIRACSMWPPDRSKLAVHPGGWLADPAKPHLAYCPECLMAFHPNYFPKHSKKECDEFKLETVQEAMEQ